MGLNDTPSGERLHIGFFGLRNAGKSSLVNAVTGQQLAVVSDVAGTTTDPVKKAMEILPLGPVEIVDTPGIDDEGKLGEKRVDAAWKALRRCDVAVLAVPATRAPLPLEEELIELVRRRGIPLVIARTKSDLMPGGPEESLAQEVSVSALTGEGIDALKELLGRTRAEEAEKYIVSDLLLPGDAVVLVIPIDASAPKGRLILPQQQVIRDILDAHCSCTVCQPEDLAAVLASLGKAPQLVVTDSQVFGHVAAIVPASIPLTSFSVLMARYKGELSALAEGARVLSRLTDASRVLVSEGCTHHRQCEDIGTVKIPAWVRAYSGSSPSFDFTSGGDFPDDLEGYDLVIHCGGCMLNRREMAFRIRAAHDAGVPIVNYGLAIAQMHGILERALRPFSEDLQLD